MERQIRAAFIQSAWDGKEFVPQDVLSKLISENLKTDLPEVSTELANFICDEAKWVFAATILSDLDKVDLVSAMETFRQKNLTDERLPLKHTNDTHSAESKIDLDQAGFQEPIWTKARTANFFRMQWIFLAPVFRADIFEDEIDDACPLPFIWKDGPRQEALDISIYEVKIHGSHQQIVQSAGPTPPSFILKETLLQGGNAIEWDRKAMAFENIPSTSQHSSFIKGTRHYILIEKTDGILHSSRHEYLAPRNVLRWRSDADTNRGPLVLSDFGLGAIHAERQRQDR